jgi:hypothetical protein
MHGIKSVSVRLMFPPKIHNPINHVLRQLPRRPSMISVVKIFLFFGLLIFYLYLSFIYIFFCFYTLPSEDIFESFGQKKSRSMHVT